MLRISDQISIADEEVEFNAIRSQGAGGQNVNKVSSAIHLRFDVPSSSLPDAVKQRLLQYRDSRITKKRACSGHAARVRGAYTARPIVPSYD